jgi:predicted DNA binding CopG/RHH family protein
MSKGTLRQEIGKRQHFVKVRMSDYEYQTMKKKCIKKTITMAEYIRAILFKEDFAEE